MKVYRRSLIKHHLVWTIFLPALILVIGFRLANGPFNIGNLCFLLLVLILFPVLALRFCYIILFKNKIVFRNSIYWGWKRQYKFQEITKVCFYDFAGVFPYMRVITTTGASLRYFVDCVNSSDYAAIVSELRKNGIEVKVGRMVDDKLYDSTLHPPAG